VQISSAWHSKIGCNIKRQKIGVNRKSWKNPKDGIFMTVRNVNDREVLETTSLAHGGAMAVYEKTRQISHTISHTVTTA
jgi:biotin-(acetyl-CoA carboxylase) ligase